MPGYALGDASIPSREEKKADTSIDALIVFVFSTDRLFLHLSNRLTFLLRDDNGLLTHRWTGHNFSTNTCLLTVR